MEVIMAVYITYFVHGTTKDNAEHKATGWNHGILSQLGIEQCKELSTQIITDQFDIVFSSDLHRAIDSAHYIFGDEIIIKADSRIRECNYGDLNGAASSKIVYSDHIEDRFPNGESLKDVEARIKSFCNDLYEKYNNKNVAIVAHRAPQLALDVLLKNLTWEEAIERDWRKTKSWQPGWDYVIKKKK